VSRLVVTIREALVRTAFGFARLLPLRPRVVLATAHADVIGGNLACIRDEMARRSPSIIPLVVLAHRSAATPGGRLGALWHALQAGYHLATARLFVVDDYFFPMYVIRPRAGTTRVQVWHASGAFKKFGYSVLDKSFGADEAMVRRVPIHANYDLCLISSMSVAPHYAEAFRQPLDKFVSRLGMPRTDLFFDEAEIARRSEAVRRRYGLPEGRRVILYAPTFRGDSVTDARFVDHLDLDLLRTMLGDDHVVMLRLHPFVRDRPRIGTGLGSFVVDVSGHPDIHELMLVSDMLVTDYSSAIYEYALLGRPILFFAPDQDAYERERGFYFDYRSGVPGPVFETTRELGEHIRAGRFDTPRVEAFGRASFDVADGRSSARFVDQIVLPALAGPAADAGAAPC
jgi:CDP-ribitol ribitolphosphotransferase